MTVAGGPRGFADGIAKDARFDTPYGVAVGPAGELYIADQANHRIRFLDAAGEVSTLAGSGLPAFADGLGLSAAFSSPSGIARDGAGKLYVADQGNHRVRVLADGVVSTLAGSTTSGFIDGPTTIALFNAPTGLALSAGKVYVADRDNHRIRMIDGTMVYTVAGTSAGYLDGPLASARLNRPTGVAIHPSGVILIADEGNNRIRAARP